MCGIYAMPSVSKTTSQYFLWLVRLSSAFFVLLTIYIAFRLAQQPPEPITPERLVIALGILSVMNIILVFVLEGKRRDLSLFSFPALFSNMGALLVAMTATSIQKILPQVGLSWVSPILLIAVGVNIIAAFCEQRIDLKILFCVNVNALALLTSFCLSDHLRLPL